MAVSAGRSHERLGRIQTHPRRGHMKKTAAAVLAVLAMAGCSSQPSTSPAIVTVTPTVTVTTTPTDPPSSPEPSVATTFTAAEEALLTTSGRTTADADAAEYIKNAHDLCETMKNTSSAAIFQALKDTTPDAKKNAMQIFATLCDDQRVLSVAIATDMPGAFADGSHYAETDLKPGKFKTVTGVQDCYWSRSDKNGNIIDNGIETAPSGVIVTIKKTDYKFESRDCGVWVPMK